QLSSLYWLNIFAGITVFLGVLIAAPVVVWLYREPRLYTLMPSAALLLLIVPLGQQFQCLLQKELKFKTLAVVEVISNLAGLIVAVAGGLAHKGPYALVLGQLTGAGCAAVATTLIVSRRWFPKLSFNYNDVKSYVSFGMYQVGERGLGFLMSRT